MDTTCLRHLKNVTSEQLLEVPNTVFNLTRRNQDSIYIFHGPLSKHKGKDKFTSVDNLSITNDTERQLLVPSKKEIKICGSKEIALVLTGLNANDVIINGAIKNILIHDCHNINFKISKEPLTGISIIKSKVVSLKLPKFNYISLESSQLISLYGELDDISQLHSLDSNDISWNNLTLPIYCYLYAYYHNGWNYKKQMDIPIVIITR